jgi:hypothetical protein
MVSAKMLAVDAPTWLPIFFPFRSDSLVMPRSLRLDHGNADHAALVVPENERLRGISAEIDLTRHHLLHGEVA